MSNIYIQEPPTHGKVLLETSVGDIEVELWSREAPKASRNFIQLCMENYYAKTKFHRLVKEFIVQGGDPSGTGRGGESVYGTPFKDEFHSRLRFCRRGLVAMANSGKDDNGSQFFFTLGPTQELQNKHTIFGKVVGDTIYNMLRLQEGIVDEDERPLNPHKIIRTKVLINPFKDITPRETIQMLADSDEEGEKKTKKKKSKMKATKDYKLLSFGDEAEDDEADIDEKKASVDKKSKSAHDLLDDPKLSNVVGDEFKSLGDADDNDDIVEKPAAAAEKDTTEHQLSSIREKLKKPKTKVALPAVAKPGKKLEEDFSDEGDDEEAEMKRKREEIRKEIKELTREMKRGGATNSKDEKVKDEPDKKKKKELTEEEKANDMLRDYHEEQAKAKKAKVIPKKGSSKREEQTLAMLAKFQQKLTSVQEESEEKEQEEADDEDEVKGDSWMSNTLKFQTDDPILAKDANTKDDNWFDIYDPRNPLNKRRRKEDSKNKRRK